METDKAQEIGRSEIIDQMRWILEPWVPDVDSLEDIDERTNLVADLGLDSIGILQMILGVEKEFGISIQNNELEAETFLRMANLVDVIQGKLYENIRPA